MVCWHVCQIVYRRVLIHLTVHIAAKTVLRSINTTKRQQTIKYKRETEVEVCCVGSSQTGTKYHHSRLTHPAVAFVHRASHKRNHLVGDIVDPLLIAGNSPPRLSALIGPGFLVNGVNGKYHHLPGLDPRRPHIRHIVIFKVKEATVLTGNEQHRSSPMSVGLTLHIPTKRRTVPFKILCFHILPQFVFFCHYSVYWSVCIKKGICLSQLASQCLPPGTMRLSTISPFSTSSAVVFAKPTFIPS